jgi:hypothetical protein
METFLRGFPRAPLSLGAPVFGHWRRFNQPQRLNSRASVNARNWPDREHQCLLTGACFSVLSTETFKCIFQSSRSARANDVFVGAKSHATTAFEIRFSHFRIEQTSEPAQ